MAKLPTSGCSYFVVPNSELEKLFGSALGIGGAAATGYSVRYACGTEAHHYLSQGFAEYPNQTEAEKSALIGGAVTGAFGVGGATGAPNNPASLPNPLSGVAAIGDFFQRLTEANTWIRVAEFAIGGILVIVGFNKMFPQVGQTVQTGARRTASVAKYAAL